MKTAVKAIGLALVLVGLAFTAFIHWAWQSVHWHDKKETAELTCAPNTRPLPHHQPLKVLSWNVQYMASKNYFFFYDGSSEGNVGPDSKPSNEHVSWTIKQIATLIREQNPDVVFLQEVNDDRDSRSHYRNQIDELQLLLAERDFPCHAKAHYWQSDFILHPNLLGSVSMHLSTLSRYKIASATRHQLPLADNGFLRKRFYFQRAILETRFIDESQQEVSLLNTHFDAWTQNSDLSQKQANTALAILNNLDEQEIPLIIGGDFNILPPDRGKQFEALQKKGVNFYNRESELQSLYQSYSAIPSLIDLKQSPSDWYTYFSNDPSISEPDRTIDYMFFSDNWELLDSEVLQGKTLEISDHLPIIAKFKRVKVNPN